MSATAVILVPVPRDLPMLRLTFFDEKVPSSLADIEATPGAEISGRASGTFASQRNPPVVDNDDTCGKGG